MQRGNSTGNTLPRHKLGIRTVYPHHASRARCMCRCGLTGAVKCGDSESECGACQPRSLLDCTGSCSSTASPDSSTHSYRSLIPGPDQLFIVCNVWSCGVKMLTAHCSAPHVAKQALKATYARPLTFKVENLEPSKFLVANKTQAASRKLTCQNCTRVEPGYTCTVYHRTCFNLNQ